MWVGQFRRQMELLLDHGFEPISFDQLIAFCKEGEELPQKPVIVTFDDGYSSFYELAFPILKELSIQATVFPIGVSVGKDTYKDTGISMIPHFDWQQAQEMASSGPVSYTHLVKEVWRRDVKVGKLKSATSKRTVPLNDTAIAMIKDLRKEAYFGENTPLVPDECGNFTRPVTVSYTHLDVYKRQVSYQWKRNGESISGATSVSLHSTHQDGWPQHRGQRRLGGCLLYTSRCV